MKFTGTTTLLFADHLEPIATFYKEVLGWAVHGEWRDDGVLKWMMVGPSDDLDGQGVRLMYNVPEDSAMGELGRQQAIPWIYVEDVEAAHGEILDRGGSPGKLEVSSSGGHEFSVEDPHGYRLYISGSS